MASTSKALNVLITGGARGIGRVLARHFLTRSPANRVFTLDADADELSYCVSKHLPQYAQPNKDIERVRGVPCDLRSTKDIRAAVQDAGEWFGGKLDVLVNNAGIARAYWPGEKTMEDEDTLEEWDKYIAVNLTGAFAVSQACIPLLKKQNPVRAGDEGTGGCVINMSSFRAHQSDPNCEGYAATKAGLLGLTHGMAISGQQWGIRVNAVLPGWINVMHECREGDEKGKEWAQDMQKEDHERHPVGRLGMGEDIAGAVEWLVGAGFVTGQEIVVDGGIQKKKNPDV